MHNPAEYRIYMLYTVRVRLSADTTVNGVGKGHIGTTSPSFKTTL